MVNQARVIYLDNGAEIAAGTDSPAEVGEKARLDRGSHRQGIEEPEEYLPAQGTAPEKVTFPVAVEIPPADDLPLPCGGVGDGAAAPEVGPVHQPADEGAAFLMAPENVGPLVGNREPGCA